MKHAWATTSNLNQDRIEPGKFNITLLENSPNIGYNIYCLDVLSSGRFAFWNADNNIIFHYGQSAPYQVDSRPAVRLGNVGDLDKGRFVMKRKAVGVTGKLWRKVTAKEEKEWQDLFDKGWTLRQIGRMYDREHGVISNHITANQKALTSNRKKAIGRSNQTRPNKRKKKPPTVERLLHTKLSRALDMARRRAERKKIDIDINYGYIKSLYDFQQGKCLLTDIPFDVNGQGKYRTNPYAPSIDRIDSDKGYTKDNVRLVVWGINWAIGEWGEEVYKQIALAYFENND